MGHSRRGDAPRETGGWGSDSAGDWTSLSLVTLDQVNTRTITDVNGLPEVLSQEISARCFFIEQFKPA